MGKQPVALRTSIGEKIVRMAGVKALKYFAKLDDLTIETKGCQDFVSDADRSVEALIRQQLQYFFPDDAIIGEEDAPRSGSSGFTWVIDPIDGTSNFVFKIPLWCIVLACIYDGEPQISLIYDPIHEELFASCGAGTTCNGAPIRVANAKDFTFGTTAVGYSMRRDPQNLCKAMLAIATQGGITVRQGSGALSLAYVAAGRFIGYLEEHMHAWDCLAGQFLIAQAGGKIEQQDANTMLAQGGRVIAGAGPIFKELQTIADHCFE
ncbi:MAG: inositol monophosphatase [Pseudomonadota bacterium]